MHIWCKTNLLCVVEVFVEIGGLVDIEMMALWKMVYRGLRYSPSLSENLKEACLKWLIVISIDELSSFNDR